MLYDVRWWNEGGYATDTVTSSQRYAIERCLTLNARGQRAHVLDPQGRVLRF